MTKEKKREEVFRAIEAIYSTRQRTTRVPVSKGEVQAYTGIDSKELGRVLEWLVSNGCVISNHGYIPAVFNMNHLCWKHGFTKITSNICYPCMRKKVQNMLGGLK